MQKTSQQFCHNLLYFHVASRLLLCLNIDNNIHVRLAVFLVNLHVGVGNGLHEREESGKREACVRGEGGEGREGREEKKEEEGRSREDRGARRRLYLDFRSLRVLLFREFFSFPKM